MKIELRDYQQSDASALAAVANNERIGKTLRDTFPYPYTEEDAKGYIALCQNTDKALMYSQAIVVDGMLAGGASLTLKEEAGNVFVEIGYWLGVDYWNQGIAKQVVNLMCAYSFHYFPVPYIQAEVIVSNIASIKVLTHCGFTIVERLPNSIYKDHMYHDLILLKKVK